eukprot:64365-Chlamydomonas_euryale.AAC.2
MNGQAFERLRMLNRYSVWPRVSNLRGAVPYDTALYYSDYITNNQTEQYLNLASEVPQSVKECPPLTKLRKAGVAAGEGGGTDGATKWIGEVKQGRAFWSEAGAGLVGAPVWTWPRGRHGCGVEWPACTRSAMLWNLSD